MPDVLIDHESAADLIVERVVDVVVEQAETQENILTEGLQGPPGPPGGQGAPGAGLVLLGALATPGDLPVAAQPGDAYLIAGDLWVFDGMAWANGGPVQGPTGEKGKDGQIRFTGHGPPPAVIFGANPLDTYMDMDTGAIYKLT